MTFGAFATGSPDNVSVTVAAFFSACPSICLNAASADWGGGGGGWAVL